MLLTPPALVSGVYIVVVTGGSGGWWTGRIRGERVKCRVRAEGEDLGFMFRILLVGWRTGWTEFIPCEAWIASD
jgi:hypothetical protein